MIDELFKNGRLRGSSRVAQQRIHRILVVKDNEDHVVNYNYRAALSPSCFNSVGKSVINSNPDTRYPLATFFHIETRASTSNTYHAAFIYISRLYRNLTFISRDTLRKSFDSLYSIVSSETNFARNFVLFP